MSFPIQASESASRVSRALKLDGKVDLQLDRLALASVQVLDLDQGAFRRDGLVGGLMLQAATAGLPLQLAGFLFVNESQFPIQVMRLLLSNDTSSGTSTFRMGLTEGVADPAGWGFSGGGQQIVSGEATAEMKVRRLPLRCYSTINFNLGVSSTLFGVDINTQQATEAVKEPISIAPGGAMFAWDTRTSARIMTASIVAKVWQGV